MKKSPYQRSCASDPAVVERQIRRLEALRSRRDQVKADDALAALADAAAGTDNLMPHILAAVEGHATLGEIADAMREVFWGVSAGNSVLGKCPPTSLTMCDLLLKSGFSSCLMPLIE